MERLLKLRAKKEKLVVGLISGTSADGVDAALVCLSGKGLSTAVRLLAFRSYNYPHKLKRRILELSAQGGGSVQEICRLNFAVGEIFAESVVKIASEAAVDLSRIDLIGSHGQTICHLPQRKEVEDQRLGSTLQIGEPSLIVKRTGIVTVADFRPADIAVGGEGAPLVPYFDYLVFRSEEKNRGVLNIGGIANLTILPKGGAVDDVTAFDTGPGNTVIDELMRKLFHRAYDAGGETSAQGRASEMLLDRLMEHAYFDMPPPKSTSADEFGKKFVEKLLGNAREMSLRDEDIIATATEFTGRSIFLGYQRYVAPYVQLDELIVSGGGSRNRTLMDSLKGHFRNVEIKKSDDFGIPADAKEAVCFAVLANETIAGNPGNILGATGAKIRTTLGKICL